VVHRAFTQGGGPLPHGLFGSRCRFRHGRLGDHRDGRVGRVRHRWGARHFGPGRRHTGRGTGLYSRNEEDHGDQPPDVPPACPGVDRCADRDRHPKGRSDGHRAIIGTAIAHATPGTPSSVPAWSARRWNLSNKP
jgi:hypothetical protein